MTQRASKEEELEAQLAALFTQNERIRVESEAHLNDLQEARKQVDHYRSKAITSDNRCKAAEDEKERQYEESQERLAMFRKAIEQNNRYKSEAEKSQKVILGLQTDLTTSLGFTQSLQSRINDMKNTFSRVSEQMKEHRGEKMNTAKLLADKMMKLRQLDHQLEDGLASITDANEQSEKVEGEETNRRQGLPPEWWQLSEETGHSLEERGSPTQPGLFSSSLDDELEECDRRRRLDSESPRLSGGESDSSTGTRVFSSIRTRQSSISPTDYSDDDDDDNATVALPMEKQAKVALNNLDDAPDSSSFSLSPPHQKKQERPEFRLDILEQSGPRKRARIREYQVKTVLKEPNPWKSGQNSRVPVALVKDLSKLTLQDKSSKKPLKPSMKQVKSILKQLPGNSQPERFRPPRPDRFKRSKRDKPARDSSAVEYTVVVDPAMAKNTNMFGTHTSANQSASTSTTAIQPTAIQPMPPGQCNPNGFHADMFAPEALAPPVVASHPTAPNNVNTTTNNVASSSTNAPLLHWGPSATLPKKQPIAKPLRKFKSLSPPAKTSPSLPRIVHNNNRGAIYRPTPYGENSTRLDLPWATWMTQMRAEKKPAPEPVQPSWDSDFFQRGSGSTDLLPVQQRVFLKVRFAIMCMAMLLFLWCLAQSSGSISDRDRWHEVNGVPQSVLRHMRGRPILNYRWVDILKYEILRRSGIDRVALG